MREQKLAVRDHIIYLVLWFAEVLGGETETEVTVLRYEGWIWSGEIARLHNRRLHRPEIIQGIVHVTNHSRDTVSKEEIR